MIAFMALAVAASFTFASCKGDGDRPEAPSPSTRDVIRTYTKTLSTAPDKARDAAEASEKRDNAQEEALKGL